MLLGAGVGGSAFVGYTDQGTIDVNQVIEARNEQVRASGSGEAIIPLQNVTQRPDGGLVGGRETTTTAPERASVDETNATSTEASTETEEATTATEETEDTAAMESTPTATSEAEASTDAVTSPDN